MGIHTAGDPAATLSDRERTRARSSTGRSRLEKALRVLDIPLTLPVAPAAMLLKGVRWAGLHRLPACRAVLRRVGVLPVRRHYYEPMVDQEMIRADLSQERELPGINLNVSGQLNFLSQCRFTEELMDIEGGTGEGGRAFSLHNGMFEHGDAEILYSLIRLVKPRRVFEIGSGNSSLVAARAIAANRSDDPTYSCRHLCIEPYEVPWLESLGIEIIRKPVEEVDTGQFDTLQAGDLLFIDSSHMIRPQGDVLHEYLRLLPALNHGVIVHVHDVFTPRDYPEEWVLGQHRLWNEQYLLEAFLTHNASWQILAAVNHLKHNHFDELRAACPHLLPEHEPGSFYMIKGSTRSVWEA